MSIRSGFVNIIGKPNAGKSTLLNALLNEKLCIVSPKPQTTRHRIFGIYNEEDCQIVFSDTPGILHPSYKLQEAMLKSVEETLADADVFLFITECGDREPLEWVTEKVFKSNTPLIVAINKIDVLGQEKAEDDFLYWKELLPHAEIIPIAALHKFNTDTLIKIIKEKLPAHPRYFDEDNISDRPVRFFVSEIIREKIFLNYQKEIPYSCDVYIESYEEGDKINKISAVIIVERDTQKGIIIGKKGESLKKTATDARKDIEDFIGGKVFLEINVKVNKNWRNDESILKKYGYLR